LKNFEMSQSVSGLVRGSAIGETLMQIKKVAVLGSGVMGSAIAAHLANAGIPSLLLDIVPKELSDADKKSGLTLQSPAFRNRFALKALNEVLPKLKPSPVFDAKVLKLVQPGNFEDDFAKIAECDWVVEVVVERLDVKESVYKKLEAVVKPGTIISSNTSGIPLEKLIHGRSENFQKNFLITHFFNPVRYMKLVEVVSGAKTNPAIVSFMADFLGEKMGKGVVFAKDTPSFIANRIGVFAIMNAVKHTLDQGLSVEAVDKIMGPAIGRPKSAVYRTIDLVGLDTILHVAKNNLEMLPNDEARDVLRAPALLETMVKNQWCGDKHGQGFYKKIKSPDGSKDILSLNLKTGEYGPQDKVRYDSLGVAKNIEDLPERLNVVLRAEDAAGLFAWRANRDVLIYAANRLGEIADDIVNIDNAMRWGFNWDLGPFEMLDAYGVADFVARCKTDGVRVPELLQTVLQKGEGRFYRWHEGVLQFFDAKKGGYQSVPRKPTQIFLTDLKQQKRVIESNASASLIDLGDGVINVEFHTKMNAIDSDIGEMLNRAIEIVESDSSYQGIVIANEAPNFSAGANLMLLWMESTAQNWSGIETLIKGFQDVCLRLRYCKKPVVAATSGLALGGGCEVTMGCDAVRAHGETYIGLVEVGAGLIPGGGGCKNLLLNIEAQMLAGGSKGWAGPSDGGPFPKVQRAFETIGFAKVATSAVEALQFGYLPLGRTQISMSRDHLIYEAKQDVLRLAKNYNSGSPREKILVAGEGGRMAIEAAIRDFVLRGLISAHDALIARKLAFVLTGGALPHQGWRSEQELLDIEREQFLSLCGEEKSQARMQHLVMKGKPLRN